MLIGVRPHGQGYAVGEVYPRMRHEKPGTELRRPHHVRTPREAAAVVVAALAQAQHEPSEEVRMQLSMLERNPSPTELQTRKERWLMALRAQVLLHFRGRSITSDDLWALMEHSPALRIPDGMSPNVLGGFFTGWKHAKNTGRYVRSERPGAHRNLLTVWAIG